MLEQAPGIPATLGHYRIAHKIGEGGMGAVFLARDEHLERDVAVKILPPGSFPDTTARKRFRKEALALSSLNHPNIAVCHDFDTAGEIDYLVMEYVAGATLSERLLAGPIPEKELSLLGEQLAEGLAAAHAEHVIHADLKPDNLRISKDGRLKILDFGLARLMRPASPEGPTATLSAETKIAGTLPYMAPEQLRGERLDARTDIWAAGVILYEASTGKRPFDAPIETRIIDEILHESPRSPSSANRHISPALESIILKCLDKDPANRYQSAAELAVDLRRLHSSGQIAPVQNKHRWFVPVAVLSAIILILATAFLFNVAHLRSRIFGTDTIHSIAVLPFQNVSQDQQQEYFSDGITEALINELSRIHALKVISSTSSMRLKNTKQSLRQTAQELNVDGIVEGSVLRVGDRVRVTAQLIEAETERSVWAETYERDIKDVLSIQADLARAISSEIRISLTPQEKVRLTRKHQINPEAHEAYLKGRYYTNRNSAFRAIQAFQLAISKDPQYAEAYAGLAQNLTYTLPAHEVMPKAKSAALKALELDASLAEAHMALALVESLYEWQWAEAGKELALAQELDPNSSVIHMQFAYYHAAMGRANDSVREAQSALALDPLSLSNGMSYGRMLYFARRYDEAIAQFKKTLELDPNHSLSHLFLGLALEQKGRYDEAMEHIIKSRRLTGSDERDKRLANLLASSYPRLGYKGTIKEWAKYWEAGVRDGTVQPTSVAMLYARAGEVDKAMPYLEQGFREHTRAIIYIKVEPQLDNLRSDPRFTDMMKRMGLPE